MHANDIGLISSIFSGSFNSLFYNYSDFKNFSLSKLGSIPLSNISLTKNFAFSLGSFSKYDII